MSTEATPNPDAPPVAQTRSPFDLLALYPSAPKTDDIRRFQAQVPGGRLRLLPMPDGKRLFLLRAFSANELAKVQEELAKVDPDKQLNRLQMIIAAQCTLWASATTNGKLTEADLQSAGAGLAPTLYQAIADLSDFTEPAYLEQLYMDF